MKGKNLTSSGKSRAIARPADHAKLFCAFEYRLEEILTDIARVLVASGYGISSLTSISKMAFVQAAQESRDGLGRRQSNAQIAARTGLTRTEVARISRISGSTHRDKSRPANRAQRVSRGWVTDSKYCDARGNPNVIPFEGGRSSFRDLVKKYSGDIPARAMWVEMQRLGMIRSEADNYVRLVRITSPIPRQSTTTLRAIRPWVHFLADGRSIAERDTDASTTQVNLVFDSLPQLYAAVRELGNRAEAFVSGIRELGVKKKVRGSQKLEISIALATRMPKLERRQKT